MKIKRIFKDIPVSEIKGSKEIEITGVCSHSKQVAPGNLFIAKKGKTVEGSQFISEAISAGAVAVVNDIYDPTLKVTQVIHPNVAEIEGLIASSYYQRPCQEMLMVGVTGTNGKTTISYLIKHLFDSQNQSCGLIGTIEYLFGSHSLKATHTTPDVVMNHKLLKEMVNHQCSAAVMEVTSHALHQNRVSEIDFDVAIFSNLSPEHLDYHKTMEAYCKEKKRLFRSIDPKRKKKGNYPKVAIVNRDDSWVNEILQGCQVPVITYGISEEADLQALDIKLNPQNTEYKLLYLGKTYEVKLPLIGRFNVYNSLATIACGISQGMLIEKILSAVETFPAVPGRLEYVPNSRGMELFVDFAHTPDALSNVLQCIRELASGKIITVFGCGGDRDSYKRPEMARISEKYSDLSVITTDNPRTENPDQIIDEVVHGFTDPNKYLVKADRRNAIQEAFKHAKQGDIVLVAGRGHEPYQTFAHHTVEFNDREVALEILNAGDQ